MSSELVNKKTDIVISNVNNKSSSVEILNLVKKSFNNHSYKINTNNPFKGRLYYFILWTTKNNTHLLQIEVNKNYLYMDEQNMLLKKNSFFKLKVCFDNLINDILFYLNYKI